MQIRPVQEQDIDALYRISLETGASGEDATHLYADPRMIGHIYSAPYAILRPDLSLVLEDQNGVAGYVVGAPDTQVWEARLEQEWWPRLRQQYPDSKDVPEALLTEDQRRASMIHNPSRTPSALTVAYPAHVHLNLLPRARRNGSGTRLFNAWLELSIHHGAPATHVGVNSSNERGLRFWERQGFRLLTHDGLTDARTAWMGREGGHADQRAERENRV